MHSARSLTSFRNTTTGRTSAQTAGLRIAAAQTLGLRTHLHCGFAAARLAGLRDFDDLAPNTKIYIGRGRLFVAHLRGMHFQKDLNYDNSKQDWPLSRSGKNVPSCAHRRRGYDA